MTAAGPRCRLIRATASVHRVRSAAPAVVSALVMRVVLTVILRRVVRGMGRAVLRNVVRTTEFIADYVGYFARIPRQRVHDALAHAFDAVTDGFQHLNDICLISIFWGADNEIEENF